MIFSNFLDPYVAQNKVIPNTFGNIGNNGNSVPNATQGADIFGAIGTIIATNTMNQFGQITPSTSPHTNTSSSNASSSSHSTQCGRCDSLSFSRCLDCNDVLCDDCVNIHKNNTFTKEHYIIGMGLNPIGGGPFNATNDVGHEMQCELHGEILRYLDESCRKIVCQECTLREHKDHICTPVTNINTENGKEKLQAVFESGKLGIKYIKSSIDRAVTYSQSVERDAMEASSRVRKAMRHFIMAAEDRERALLEQVDKYRQQKLTSLSDQMTGLRSALAGLAQVSDKLTKAIENCNTMNCIDIATTLTNSESQIEKFALMYKNLQPKEEFITFVPPNFELLQDIRMQGEIAMNVKNANGSSNGSNNGSTPSPSMQTSLSQTNLLASSISAAAAPMSMSARRPIVRNPSNGAQSRPLAWDTAPSGKPTMAAVLRQSTTPVGQCIPGSTLHVSAKPALGPSTTFGFDGQEDGQVSRPWGLCVDKDNNIIIADRRNNRVQVFYPDGTYKFKFGSKGTGNGQFDLPAGICTDPQNRIVVVDKDNHRIQIFTALGAFVLKFGSFGKECGQFQYPWDVAVNVKGEILVTDSRNHRIQLFNSDGHFLSRFSFDGVNHSRQLRGLTTPRGCCFNPQGDIIISDFENHRLILIDSCLTKVGIFFNFHFLILQLYNVFFSFVIPKQVLALKGHEGSALHEFCRPSGVCCDDDGRVIVADSKNQRVLIFSPSLEFLWAVEIRPSSHNLLTQNMDEKDRPSDVALLTGEFFFKYLYILKLIFLNQL